MKERKVNRVAQLRQRVNKQHRQGEPKGSKWLARLMRQERQQARHRKAS